MRAPCRPALPCTRPLVACAGHWSSLPAVTSDLFGLASFSTLYCLLQLAPASSAFGFASLLMGAVQQREADAQGATGDCLGRACFAPAFQVSPGL
jgi:hypothetical protein